LPLQIGAFRNFGGKVIFQNDPFPSLAKIYTRAFSFIANRDSRVELINQHVLQEIPKEAFYQYDGTVILKGNLKSLRQIGTKAFYCAYHSEERSRAVDACTNNTFSVVQLQDLPSLVAISFYAFYDYPGTLEISGSFPALEQIGHGVRRYMHVPTAALFFSFFTAAHGLHLLAAHGYHGFPTITRSLLLRSLCRHFLTQRIP
jgi:hypothetical protein